jgi:hypothetical protein
MKEKISGANLCFRCLVLTLTLTLLLHAWFSGSLNSSLESTTDDSIQLNRRQLFVNRVNQTGIIHLGKCGGVSLRLTIGYRTKNNAIAATLPLYYHMFPPNITRHSTWIALVRDPIERIQSAYVYEHPDNERRRKDNIKGDLSLKRKLYKCYPSLNQLVTIGLATPSESHNDCPMLARRVLLGGHVSGMVHFRMNFAAYYSQLLENREQHTIYVVRREHMLHDLNNINILMGGKQGVFARTTNFEHFRPGPPLPVMNRTMSRQGQRNLCRMLCSEIQIYKHLLIDTATNNLQYEQTSGPQLALKCPDEANATSCPYRATLHEGMPKDLQNQVVGDSKDNQPKTNY